MSKTRMGKRVASLLLSLVMMLSLLPTTVYATGDTGETKNEIVGQATTSGDNTEGTSNPEPTGEDEGGGTANVSEGEDGAATNDAVVEETIAPVNAEGVDAVANAESTGDEVSGEDGSEAGNKAETYVAQVGDTKYATLKDAIAAAEAGQTVTLLDDVDLGSSKIGFYKTGCENLTFDLNGHKITSAIQNNGTVVASRVGLVIKNGTIENTCMDTNAKKATSAVYVTSGGTTTLENVTLHSNYSGLYVCQLSNAVTVVVNVEKDTVINGGMYGVNLDAPKGTATTAPGVTLNVNGGTITGTEYGIHANSPSSGKYGTINANITAGTVDGVGVVSNNTKRPVKLDITGGTINGELYNSGSTVTISGGTFTTKPNETYLAGGYVFAANADGTYGVVEAATAVAQIGDKEYATLAEAFAAAKDGDTITLLTDCSGDGISVKPETFTAKGLTVDFNNHRYTVGGVLVGSSGTASNAFQLLKGNKITFKNGAIYGDASVAGDPTTQWTGAPAMMIQNYCDLTLQNMTVVGGKETCYTLSNNNGNVVIEDTTIKAGNGTQYGPFAFDICRYSSYPSVSVTVKGNSVIEGNVEVSGTIGEGQSRQLNIEGGTFKGTFTISGNVPANIAISGGTFTSEVPAEYCADGYIPTKNTDNTYGVKQVVYVAETNNVKYETLQKAIDAAKRNDTVKLLADTKENVTISTPYLTLDLNGFTLNGSTGEREPALTVTARVTVKDSSEKQTGTIMRDDTAENSGVSSHYVIDIQGAGWLTFESGNVKNDSGNAEGKGASLVRVGDDSVAKYPGLNIKGGTFTQDNFIVIKVDSGDLFLNGGTLNSTASYAIENWHRATIKGGTVNGAVAAWTYNGGHNSDLTISGGTINGNIESVSYDGAAGKKASVSITGGVVNGMLSTHIYNKETEPSKDIATIEVTGGTFKEDPTKYLVECSTVNKNADGTFGVAKAYLATVGETSYYTMDEAFKAQTASGKDIVMLRDYTTGSAFSSGSINRTVDLNDHTWICTGTDANSAAFEINHSNVTLTVKNGKIVSSQLVGLIPSAMGGTIKYDNSNLLFDGVVMTTTATSGIETNGNNTNDAVTLKNSTLNVPNGFGIYFPSSGKLTIDNSTINAKTMGVQVCAGSLSINAGSTITVSGDAVHKTENDGAIQDGAAISIVNRIGYKDLGKIEVTGGTFKANGTNEAIKAYDWKDNNATEFTANEKVFVSGGTFSSAVPEGLCAEGYISVAKDNGTHTVKEGVYVAQVGSTKYESLAAAIGAAQDSDTVTLLKDIDLPATAVVKGKTITLDLNGKTISNSTDIWNESKYAWSLISVRDNGDLTINDTTGGGTLKAKENDCFALDVYAYDTKNVEDTKLTINAGNYVGNISAVYAFTGKATINGGHFSIQQKESGSDPYRLTLNCYDSSYTAGRAGFTVNGGTFENFDPRNNPAEGAGTSFVAEGVGVNNENGNFTAVPNMAAQRIAADGSSVEAYATLADAIAAAQDGQTVMLLADVNGNVEIAAGKNLTLDLNGKILNGGTVTGKAALTNYGTITIKDSSEEKTGTIKRDDNGTVGETSYYVILNQGTMTIESGTVINNSGYKKPNSTGSMVGSSLICNGDCNEGGTLTIKGGTFTQDNFIAIKNGALGVLHVTGGTITSKHSAIQNWFKADITGGEIKGQLWTDAYKKGESVGETKIGGNAKFNGEIVMDIYGSVAPELAITGGDLDVTSWRITPAAAKAGAKPAVSGGTFSSKVPPEYCAPGYVPTGEGADGRFTVAEGEFTVQVTSRTVSSESPVAHVSGGGSGIKYATGTTATTTTVAGYEFVGWYVDNYPDGKCLGKELTISYKPTANCTLVAVYEPISGGTFELKVDASKFQVNGGATNTSKFSAKLAANSLVTINFTGDNFLYWVNGSGKVVSTSKEYKFTLVSATVLSAVYTNSEADEAQVIFLTANPDDPNSAPQIVSSKAYAKGTTTISFPAPPVRIGKRFTGWSMTEEQIIAAIPGANVELSGKILVYAMYEDQERPCTVTVSYGDKQQKISATIGTRVVLTALPQQVDGKEFSCWKDSEGKVLGTTSNLYVTPVGNMTVYAVYGETVEQRPTISMLKPVASVANEKYVVTFSAVRSIPDGYTIEELGILYSMDKSYGDPDAEKYMVLGSDGEVPAGVYRARATQTTPLGTVRCNITTGFADRTFYARGYMILKDSEGNIAPYYSEIASGSYNSLTNGGN